jgi:hypothetical protein
MMNIKATTSIEVQVNEHRFKLTREEAEQLYSALRVALGNSSYIKYPDGVREIPIGNPNPYTLTCKTR